MTSLEVRPLGYHLGAEVRGVDLKRPVPAETFEEIVDLSARHLVLVFPDQHLSAGEQVAFSRQFGELDQNEALPFFLDPEYPEVFIVTTRKVGGKPSETRHTGRDWHSDLSTRRRPIKKTLLNCHALPPVGGDTIWANMVLAYERLSPTLRAFLDGLWGIHDIGTVQHLGTRNPEQVAELYRRSPPVAHPVVREIPETGQKALYISDRVRQFVGMTVEESRPLLDFLCRHATQPEFCYRHRWALHDLVIWDNRGLVHIALPDFDLDQERHMHRTSTVDDHVGVFESDLPQARPRQRAQAEAAAR